MTNQQTGEVTAAIELRNVTKRFLTPTGQIYTALHDLTMSVAPGEFCAIVGPTGCGKSTTLGLISGLEKPSLGEVKVMDNLVQGIDPRIGYVFQSDAVFPWKNVLNNVATGPLFRGQPKAEALKRARGWVERVGLAGFEDRYPHQLSGGQRQRVGVARALAADPPILLMDEPFGALDPLTRSDLQREFLLLQKQLGKTVLFVTHDLHEALRLGTRIALLEEGRLVSLISSNEFLTSSEPLVKKYVEAFGTTDRQPEKP